jgi:hypothetical protein
VSEAHEAFEPAEPDRDPGAAVRTEDPSAVVPSLPVRLLQTVVSPVKVATTLAAHPKWMGAMLVGAALLALSVALIPLDVLEAAQRRAMIAAGRDMQGIPEGARNMIRTFSIIAPAVAFVAFAFIGAALTTFIFAFVLGDGGRYRQYLAVGVHAGFIPTAAAVLLAPMRVAAENPQLTINVSTFLFFFPEGYASNVLRALDLTQVWASLVVAQGVHAIDRRRSFGSAAAIQLGILFVFALIAGWFMTRQGL